MSTIAYGVGLPARALRLRQVGAGLVTVAVAAALWFLAAPAAIGGPTSYVVTQGISMLPHFHANGLVLTRAEGDYSVGEVVAYHNRQLKAVVMHRIVAVDGSRFVMKGDNNFWRDTYHPTKADIVGKEWVYLPGAGQYLGIVRQPVIFAFILGGLGLIAGTGLVPRRRSRRHRRHAH